MTKRAQQASRTPAQDRHMLYVEPPKPLDELTRDEFETWKRENGERFLMRLSWFKRLAPAIGPTRAAGLLKACQSDYEAQDLWDRVRCNRPMPDAGGVPIGAKW